MVGLSLAGVSRSFFVEGREVPALRDLDFDLAPGEIAAIVGPSGSGKTTLLRIAAGLESVDAGLVTRRADARIGFVFQEPRLLSSLSVEGNISLGLGRGLGRDGAERVRETIELLGLSDFRRAYPSQLSGGIAQRVSLGRALVREPELLFMDEPFSALDAPLRRRLQDELLAVLERRRAGVLFVTHDIEEALYLGDRVLALRLGSIVRDEPIGLDRPRDRRSADFLDFVDSLAHTLGEGAYGPSTEDGHSTGSEEDSV
jgi:sulfonate transport system ATP-binding protein